MDFNRIYENSVRETPECACFMASDGKGKYLVVTAGSRYEDFEGTVADYNGSEAKKCPLSQHNSSIIREIFAFTNPVSVGDRPVSIGLGDRLGLASAGHIKLLKDYDVFPILAQQSIRELNLTGRTYKDVLSDVVFAVLQEGYEDGYGADGDHLKTHDEVLMALECGFTMITLDCSEHINNDYQAGSGRIGGAYTLQEYWEGKYLNKTFKAGDFSLTINEHELADTVGIYQDAITFAESIYNEIIRGWDKPVDFEISIDETLMPTIVKAHFIIASELRDRGVKVKNMAPRFCGEFQKGIDYRGNMETFKEEFMQHQAIAEYFGYRLSIHSGSDKFSVFPIIGSETGGRFHLKTAGTNWLEAMRVIARCDYSLFRSMYEHACTRLNDAKAYYHISTNIDDAPDSSVLKDEELAGLLDIETSRQILHITYGYLLGDTEGDRFIFKDRFFGSLHEHEDSYYANLASHIGRHLTELGL